MRPSGDRRSLVTFSSALLHTIRPLLLNTIGPPESCLSSYAAFTVEVSLLPCVSAMPALADPAQPGGGGGGVCAKPTFGRAAIAAMKVNNAGRVRVFMAIRLCNR